MYSGDVIGKKPEKVSVFSVVIKISTNGGTLKNRVWNNLSYFLDVEDHENFDSGTQMTKNDVNKGHIVDFRKILSKKSLVFSTKKFIEIFSMIHSNF